MKSPRSCQRLSGDSAISCEWTGPEEQSSIHFLLDGGVAAPEGEDAVTIWMGFFSNARRSPTWRRWWPQIHRSQRGAASHEQAIGEWFKDSTFRIV